LNPSTPVIAMGAVLIFKKSQQLEIAGLFTEPSQYTTFGTQEEKGTGLG